MRRLILLLPALLFAAACGNSGGSADLTAPGDMTMLPDFTTAPPDLKPLQTGTQLAPGPQGLSGVTEDDWAIVATPDGTVSAVAATGGAPKEVDQISDIVAIRGKAVFSWSKYDAQTATGDLKVWTAAAGTKTLGAGGHYAVVVASDDSAYIAYALASNGTTADLWVAKADGSDAKKMWSAVNMGSACRARMAFIPGNKVLTTRCADNTPGKATLSTFDVATGNAADIVMNIYAGYGIDRARAKIVIVTETGEAQVLPTAGGSPTKIDTNLAWWLITPDGNDVIYGTSAKALKRSPVATPAPVTLVPDKVESLLGASSNYKWAIYASKFSTSSGNSDLFLADLTTAKAPVTLSTATSGVIYGDPFTADSTHALYITMANAMYIGVLNAIPVAGGMPKVIGQKVWVAYNASGTTIVYNDNYKPLTGQNYGRADLFSTDVATNNAPKLLATQADADFYLNTAKDKVFYTISTGAGAGLYLAPVQ